MSDNLRTRIAAALLVNLLGHFKPWTDSHTVFHFWAKDLDAPLNELPHGVSHNLRVIAERQADAVIEALGLQPPGLQRDGSFIDAAGTVWRHNGLEWTDDGDYKP